MEEQFYLRYSLNFAFVSYFENILLYNIYYVVSVLKKYILNHHLKVGIYYDQQVFSKSSFMDEMCMKFLQLKISKLILTYLSL